MSDTLVPEAPSVAAVTEGVLRFSDLLDAASGTDWSRLDGAGVADLLDAVEEVARKLPAVVGGALVREVSDRGLATEAGCRSTVSYLQHKLRLSRGEAAGRVQAAERFQPRTQLSGEILPPRFPKVAAAMQTGEISGQHGKVIADSLQRLLQDQVAQESSNSPPENPGHHTIPPPWVDKTQRPRRNRTHDPPDNSGP